MSSCAYNALACQVLPRLAIDRYDPEICRMLFSAPREWLAEAAQLDTRPRECGRNSASSRVWRCCCWGAKPAASVRRALCFGGWTTEDGRRSSKICIPSPSFVVRPPPSAPPEPPTPVTYVTVNFAAARYVGGRWRASNPTIRPIRRQARWRRRPAKARDDRGPGHEYDPRAQSMWYNCSSFSPDPALEGGL
jgi:hypothetical protein